AKTGKKLNNNQHIFRRYNYETNQTTYFYRTNRKLVGKRVHPIRTKKHYRIGRNINPHPLLEQVQNHPTKPVLELKSNQKIYTQDFKQLVYSKLSALAETIRIVKIPLPKKYVPKEDNKCIRDVHHHFGFKIITYLTFPPENIPKAKEFLDQLDEHANEYGVPESKD
ncbi:2818_t:CDS:1, partial [Ambispora leptoticha]